MRTSRSLTICRSLLPWGVSVPGRGSAPRGPVLGRGSAPGGVCSWGCLLQGGVCSGGSAPGGLLPGVCSRGVSAPGGCLLQGGVCSGGVCCGGCLLRGFCSRGVYSWGVSAPRGWCGIPACTEADTPPVNRITHTCKNITLTQLRCGR